MQGKNFRVDLFEVAQTNQYNFQEERKKKKGQVGNKGAMSILQLNKK